MSQAWKNIQIYLHTKVNMHEWAIQPGNHIMKKLNNHATIPANNTRFLYSSRSNSIQYHKLFHTFHVEVFSLKRYWMLWILQVKQYRYLGAESKIRCVRWASLLGTASVSSVNIYKSLNHCVYWVHVIHMFIWCLYARQYNAPINEYTGDYNFWRRRSHV